MLQRGQGRISLRAVLFNPGVIGSVVGFLFFLLRFTIPDPFASGIGFVAQLNTALAMMTTGILLARVDLRALFGNLRICRVAAIRLLVIPLAVLGAFWRSGFPAGRPTPAPSPSSA
jgi:predicted permease